jgi:hypothetical protein
MDKETNRGVSDEPLTPSELTKIRTSLDEFERELEASEDLGAVFQVGYYVSAADIRRLLAQLDATEAERDRLHSLIDAVQGADLADPYIPRVEPLPPDADPSDDWDWDDCLYCWQSRWAGHAADCAAKLV